MQLANEDALDAKNMEIARLTARLLNCTLPSSSPPLLRNSDHSLSRDTDHRMDGTNVTHRRGKAPPVDSFSAEGLEEHWDEWLPTFERAADWNSWNDAERLLQLAGHLRGKARQEFSLLTSDERSTFDKAKNAMRNRLEVGSKALSSPGL